MLRDDGIYMMTQIYNHPSWQNDSIQVGQVFLVMTVLSGYLKDQRKKVWIYKILYKQVMKEIIVLSHIFGLLQQWVEY